MTTYHIRTIQLKDDKPVEAIIRSCLIEFGGNHEGTAWTDPDLGRFYEIYHGGDRIYYVAEDKSHKVVGGVGIGPLPGVPGTCELQKMYCLPEARGTGIAHQLLTKALEFATEHYNYCYLETLPSMVGAQKFYEKHGFVRVQQALTETGHTACDVRYEKKLER